ncbi:TatD DNase family protein [Candidatus Kinetoplastibacterium blastocrithidii TCC012E]|uniref:TatD DNase family protein n=1 Tax=Candidatus Kinetoplastidibacterium blastocrithidiae TCC012E TaxID=1208922 RepID=M1LBG7_9PROT|nr:TatD family hydrolase [Candidatus Kinetoplastibacterium blastocrithidii]AFZ83652.1 TatD DNase family protein [Candidatus Kinetoplastibacterium blastocrithidii (ex Strigomonas culicis)]AGF49773.1 TatD DNase family protein [Candidatus Kinetoplastibacterium blastocrithidii TCC012E]
MFIDSHCHLNFPELSDKINLIQDSMLINRVTHALVVSVGKKSIDSLINLVSKHDNLLASVGTHPEYGIDEEFSVDDICSIASINKKIIAIGETGLDYYRGSNYFEVQKERFRQHIRAARILGLPLIVHTRSSAVDTIRILKEEKAYEIGGVMHCFTESWDIAKEAMNLNFFISISGIVTFKNATTVCELALKTPLDKLLIETDSPYLTPEPYRGKLNDPSNVFYVAKKISELRNIDIMEVGKSSTKNFFDLFKVSI